MRAARVPLLIALLAVAVEGFTETAIDVLVSSGDLTSPAAAISASLALDEQRAFGEAAALQWDVEAAGTFGPADGSAIVSGSVWLEASRILTRTTVAGWVSASSSGSSSDGVGPTQAGIGASLVFNGETAGCSVEPWAGIRAFVDPFLETGLAIRGSILAGPWVLEPFVAAGPRWDADAGLLVRLEPGLEVSWYPGIPLSIDAGFRWAGAFAEDGGRDSEWVATLSVSGALGGVILLDGSGSLRWGGGSISGDARAEVAIVLATARGVEFSIPIRFSVSGSDLERSTAGIAAGLRLSW